MNKSHVSGFVDIKKS